MSMQQAVLGAVQHTAGGSRMRHAVGLEEEVERWLHETDTDAPKET